jgi:hypothetical protein
MMKNVNENLSEIFDIDPIQEQPTQIVPVESSVVQDDAEFARQNIRELIQKGNVAMDQLLHVAKESEHPRAYEVAAGLIKNLSDLNKDLMEIQKRKQDLTGEKTTGKNINVDKAVFVGSTTELVKFLKSNKE